MRRKSCKRVKAWTSSQPSTSLLCWLWIVQSKASPTLRSAAMTTKKQVGLPSQGLSSSPKLSKDVQKWRGSLFRAI